jgi:hypothetical protein
MIAALSLMLIFTISFTFVRIAAVAMRLTGLSENMARFQALSALTGTGFTTTESEMIVNYPVRRNIISVLMVFGNLGIVTVMSTLMVSFLRTDAELGAIIVQVGWIVGGGALLCIVMLNKHMDRILCGMIAFLLKRFTFLGKRSYHRILQIGSGLSIAEHQYRGDNPNKLANNLTEDSGLTVIAIRRLSGEVIQALNSDLYVCKGDMLILLGIDQAHEEFSRAFLN